MKPCSRPGRCRLLVVGLDHFPDALDVFVTLGVREQTDIPTQPTAHGCFLPLLKTPDKKHVGKHEGRKAGSRCGLYEGDFIAVKLWGPRDEKVSTLFQKISPVAWQHIHFSGHYVFRDNYSPIELEVID
ncbi:MAG: hypothetical protein ABIN99_01910 [Nitrosospira sp.]